MRKKAEFCHDGILHRKPAALRTAGPLLYRLGPQVTVTVQDGAGGCGGWIGPVEHETLVVQVHSADAGMLEANTASSMAALMMALDIVRSPWVACGGHTHRRRLRMSEFNLAGGAQV
jgi:hypothetical protein